MEHLLFFAKKCDMRLVMAQHDVYFAVQFTNLLT